MTNKSKGSYAYTMIDVDNGGDAAVADELQAIPNVLRVRVIS